jgi:hypothetical protein
MHELLPGAAADTDAHHRSCASATDALHARAYRLPRHWPFDPIHLIMETEPGRCNLYTDANFFCAVSRFDEEAIESHVRDAIASILSGCHRRTCHAIDLGSNNGWMSAFMLDLGARVVSVEPQFDLAQATRETAALN